MSVAASIQITKSVLALKHRADHDEQSHGNRGKVSDALKITGGASSMQSLVNNVAVEGSAHARDEISSAILSGAKQKYAVWEGSKIIAAAAFGVNEDAVNAVVELHHIGSLRSGFGSSLMKKVKEFAARKRLPIRANIHEDAKKFYEKHGFKQVHGTLYEYKGT